MKKFIFILLCVLCLLCTCGCGNDLENLIDVTTLEDGRVRTVMYSDYDGSVNSISTYNPSTGITTEIIYYYDAHGYGTYLEGTTLYTLDAAGNILETSEGGNVE